MTTDSNKLPVSLKNRIFQDIKSLLVINKTARPWHLPLLASFCVGIPVFIGALFEHFDYGVLGSIGALVIVYIPQTNITHRMLTLVVCSFGFSVCFALGVSTSFNPFISAFTLTCIAMLVTVIVRYYALPPPGNMFFIMVASLATIMPFDLALLPMRVGVIVLGGMLSCLLALIYSIYMIRKIPVIDIIPKRDPNIIAIMLESAVIALFIGLSYLTALLVGLENPYWVPISCTAVLQGATFRHIWHRQIHRIVGTGIGLVLAALIFSLPINIWELVAAIFILQFFIEFLIVRNYGLAVIFITPLTIILAGGAMNDIVSERVVFFRLVDITLGSIIGFIGGWVTHHPHFFKRIEARIRHVRY